MSKFDRVGKKENSTCCDYCKQDPGTKECSPVWLGFRDQDTTQQVCNNCKAQHYKNKFSTPGLKGLYSEVPVIIIYNDGQTA